MMGDGIAHTPQGLTPMEAAEYQTRYSCPSCGALSDRHGPDRAECPDDEGCAVLAFDPRRNA